ncbi:NPCBM/NEW2 domain-containing protein [Pseudoxanthomonas sp. JBR18]|uniref:NPCBM/NEW2 domain-containing protein n=1 Tax=Pseudoxanthomonas sp. JBR18 TaxID=2969308 RepID=UPI0023061D54|nr:NPCBM/NEW2 domain-containing protein [Pseudoxanthomonas sp. JBR18]WCE04994.1 NPCBM/NEW2 domain-containing protein [Pseudoxanthomonas sp. JBR18]
MKRMLLATLLSLSALPAAAGQYSDALQPSGRFSVYGHGAAATPPMGFNPWNAFRTEVDQARIASVVDALQQRGLQDAGYRYVNIDDGWWLRRDAQGRIEIRTSMFPIAQQADGGTSFRAWTDMLHARGFKAGLYTDAGRNACSQAFDRHSPNLPVGSVAEREIGLQGFEASDLKTMFQDWGFDYLKVDACGLADFGAGSEPVKQSGHRALRPLIVRGDAQRTDADAVETRYARVGRLLADLNPDGDFVLSICPWGEAGVRDWGGEHGNLWRTSPDIEPTWASMLHNFDSASRRELYAGPGRWNDPDMLAIGLGEFDAQHLTQARTHFSLWAMLSAPLLLGFDLREAPQPLIDLLTNPEVIAIDQDPAGNQAVLVADGRPVQVLVKPLATRGERAVLLFNRGDAPATAQVTPAQMKLADDASIRMRDLWRHADLPQTRGALRFALAPHQAMLLKVRGTPVELHGALLSEMTGRIHVAADGLPSYSTALDQASGTPRADATPEGLPLQVAGEKYAYGIGTHADSRLEVATRGEFARFAATVGLQDNAGQTDASVVFRVYGDGKLLHATAPLTAGKSADLDIDTTGVSVLELVAASQNAPAGSLPPVVAWADARLRQLDKRIKVK